MERSGTDRQQRTEDLLTMSKEALSSIKAKLANPEALSMDEATYNEIIATVKAAVEEAAETFKEAAAEAVDGIAAAKEAYLSVIEDADTTLDALDEAAKDVITWEKYNVRYMGDRGRTLATLENTGWNPVTCAAWEAARRAGKDF